MGSFWEYHYNSIDSFLEIDLNSKTQIKLLDHEL